MLNYRRALVEGASYFCTVVTFNRLTILKVGTTKELRKKGNR